MSKVITFSRTFPAYHPKAGQPTYFVEKVYNSFFIDALGERFFLPFEEDLYELNQHVPFDAYTNFRDSLIVGRTNQFDPKYHTIREGHRWNVGDKFSPRVWSGKPYSSKQITIAPDIEILSTWNMEVDEDLCIWVYTENEEEESILERLAQNDGLSLQDLQSWFNKPMAGQIICWNKNISY